MASEKRSDPESYRLTDQDWTLANTLARATLEVFRNRPGHYTNNLNSHLRGKCGEIAATRILERIGVEVASHWTDVASMSMSDMTLNERIRVDVKTWSETYWEDMGRCIALSQLNALKAKADAIVWCRTPQLLAEAIEVVVAGWSSMKDIDLAPVRFTGPEFGRKVENYQLDEHSLRKISTLKIMCNR